MVVGVNGENTMSLNYDPSKVPTPVTAHDEYLYATLIETRLIRMALQALVTQGELKTVNLQTTSDVTGQKSTAKK